MIRRIGSLLLVAFAAFLVVVAWVGLTHEALDWQQKPFAVLAFVNLAIGWFSVALIYYYKLGDGLHVGDVAHVIVIVSVCSLAGYVGYFFKFGLTSGLHLECGMVLGMMLLLLNFCAMYLANWGALVLRRSS